MQITIIDEVKEVIEAINSYNYEAYLIGGAVRDSIIGKDNNDYDLCTNMPLEQIKKIFPQFVIMRENDHRNTGVVRINGKDIEISQFHGKTIEEDLSKRDLTMNAIAADKDGNLIDPFGGVEDINNRIIRLVNKDGEGIDIDPLRILRVLRFSALMDFQIETHTKEVIKNKRKLLKRVAKERIYSEISKILLSNKPSKVISENKEIFATIIPDLEPTIGYDQKNPYHSYDLFTHTLNTIDNTEKNIYLRLAALFHDLGKPNCYFTDDNGIGHYYGHELVSAKMFMDFAAMYKLPNELKDKVSKLIYYHDYQLSLKTVKIRKFLKEFGISDIDLLFKLKKADKLGQSNNNSIELEEIERVRNLYLQEASREDLCLSVKDLKINGRKLMEMGFYDKKIGIILKDVLDKVIASDLVNESLEIEEYVSNNYK